MPVTPTYLLLLTVIKTRHALIQIQRWYILISNCSCWSVLHIYIRTIAMNQTFHIARSHVYCCFVISYYTRGHLCTFKVQDYVATCDLYRWMWVGQSLKREKILKFFITSKHQCLSHTPKMLKAICLYLSGSRHPGERGLHVNVEKNGSYQATPIHT